MSLQSLTCDYLIKNLPDHLIDELIEKSKENPIKYDVVLFPVLPSKEDFIYPSMGEEIFLPDMKVFQDAISFLLRYYEEFNVNNEQCSFLENYITLMHLERFANFKELLQYLLVHDDLPDYWTLYKFVKEITINYHNFGFNQNVELLSFIREHHYEQYFEIIEIEKYSYVYIEYNNGRLRYQIERDLDKIKFNVSLPLHNHYVFPLKIYQIK